MQTVPSAPSARAASTPLQDTKPAPSWTQKKSATPVSGQIYDGLVSPKTILNKISNQTGPSF